MLSEEAADVATMPAALLAGKTLCNLCCIAEGAATWPLAPQQHAALLDAISWPEELALTLTLNLTLTLP